MSHTRKSEIATPKDEMRTPPWLFKLLDDKYHFHSDLAATQNNALCESFFPQTEDNPLGYLSTDVALKPGSCNFLNPPYSKGQIEKFITKARSDVQHFNAAVVALLPVDFSTYWWNDVMQATEWWRIPFRIKFYGIGNQEMPGTPWFDSMIAVFAPVNTAYAPRVRTLEIPESVMSEIFVRRRKDHND